ncbi:MAG TPA: hypothetical protein VNA57_03910 [Acidimicrobiales bacterium]|nr:hypothetical protein [Acidimicrobiales bacterium]
MPAQMAPILVVVGVVVIGFLVALYASIGRGDLLDVAGGEVGGELDELPSVSGVAMLVMARTLE